MMCFCASTGSHAHLRSDASARTTAPASVSDVSVSPYCPLKPISRRLCVAQSLGCADDMARPLHTATQPKSAQQQLEYQDLRELIPSRRFTLAAAVAAVALTLGGSPAAAEDRAPTPSIPGPSLIPNADPSSRPQPIPSPSKDNAPIPVQGTASSAADAREVYVSPSKDYSVQVPTAWERKDKAGADSLWENPDRRSTSVGITVNPVRVKSIEEFGTLETVGGRLLDLEKKKESTLSVSMVSQSSRRLPDSNALLYDFEYELDSTRGRKRILNSVTIYDSKLFILNAAYKCEKPPKDAAVAAGAGAGDGGGKVCVTAPGALDTLRGIASSFAVMSPGKK